MNEPPFWLSRKRSKSQAPFGVNGLNMLLDDLVWFPWVFVMVGRTNALAPVWALIRTPFCIEACFTLPGHI